jgi:DNA invertase Pin-like site-specific DNA recombinase
MASLAQMERELIVERTRAGLEALRKYPFFEDGF